MLRFLSFCSPAALRGFLLWMLCSGALAAYGQGNAPAIIRLSPEDVGRGLNGAQRNFFFSTKDDATDDDYQNAGFFGQRLRPYIASNPEAIDNLNRYRRQKWLFLGERLVFVGAVATYGAQVLTTSDEKQVYFSNPQKVTIGVAAAALLANVFITRRTNEHFERAVESYNAGTPSASRYGWLRQLAPSGVGLGASATGAPQVALRWQLR